MKKIALFGLALFCGAIWLIAGCSSGTTTPTTTTTTTVPMGPPHTLTVSGTLSFAAAYSTTESSVISIFRSKGDIPTGSTMTYEVVTITGAPFHYSLSYTTTEVLPFTCYLVGSHPYNAASAAAIAFVAGQGVTHDDSITNDLLNLQSITSPTSTSLSADLVFYRVTGR